MRIILLLFLTNLALAQTIEYKQPLRQVPLSPASPFKTGITGLAVHGDTLLLTDAKSNQTYRLPGLQPLNTLPPGKACPGSREVAIYRQGALEIYAGGKLAARWKQPEPCWFGEVANQWLVVAKNSIELGPLRARRKIKLKQKAQVQIFSVWQEENQLHLSTTDSEGSTFLNLRLKDGKQLEPEVVRGDISIRWTSPHYTLNGQFTHPGDTNASLYDRHYNDIFSTTEYFPISLSEANGRLAYMLHPSDGPRDLLEVADPKAALRWTWQGPEAHACGLSGDGHTLAVLAGGKVYIQPLFVP